MVSACVISLRWKDKMESEEISSSWKEGVICLITIACCGFGAGLFYRVNASLIFPILAVLVASLASLALCFRQVSINLYFMKCLLTCYDIKMLLRGNRMNLSKTSTIFFF